MKTRALNILAAVAFTVSVTACGSSGQDEAKLETTTSSTSTTLSVADQTKEDEALIRDVMYRGSQLCSEDVVTAQLFTRCSRFDWENTFPPYREFITDAAFDACVDENIGYGDSSLWIQSMIPQLGSSMRTPDWVLKAELENKTVWSTTPEDAGRTYMIRTKIVTKGQGAGESDQDIHFVIVDGRAYYFSNWDYCLKFKDSGATGGA